MGGRCDCLYSNGFPLEEFEDLFLFETVLKQKLFETVFEKAHDADIWLLKNSTTHDQTYESIVKEFASYSQFKPYKTKNIWVCDVYQVPYFESTSFHPENLLEEYISILHPELLTDYRQRWYHPMREAGE